MGAWPFVEWISKQVNINYESHSNSKYFTDMLLFFIHTSSKPYSFYYPQFKAEETET